MPLQNRVRPDGEIVAYPERGAWMGNRGGRLHRPDRTLGSRRWVNRRWICCRLAWKDRRRRVMGDGYTELFFLDEATALAAGHRPCFECRRADALLFADLFGRALGMDRRPTADEIDLRLDAERTRPHEPTHEAPLAGLPRGAMFRVTGGFGLCLGGRFAAWSPQGYRSLRVPNGERNRMVAVLTPRPIVDVLAAGYAVQIHPSAESDP